MKTPVSDRKGKKRLPARLRRPGRVETVAARQLRAIELRKVGCTYERIAQETGVSVNQSWRDVQRALDVIRAERNEDARSLRVLELERLDLLWSRLMPAVMKGDCEAIRAGVKVSERKSRLLGLDAAVLGVPITLRPADYVQGYAGMTDDALARRLEQMRTSLALPEVVVQPEPEQPVLSEVEKSALAYATELASRNGKGSTH